MSKYDLLDASEELEQEITNDLKRALEKRGFTVEHKGTQKHHAPGKTPDIIAYTKTTHINIEVTKRKKSSSDSEFFPIKEHLEQTKEENPTKQCFLIYISPETHYRMINALLTYNSDEKKEDMKILPLSFSTFELLITKLVNAYKDEYQEQQITSIFKRHREYVDDERILCIIYELLFSQDKELGKQVEQREEQVHQLRVEQIVKEFLKLEDTLREELGITHVDAVRTIIFLVFMKLYEEKRFAEGKSNRFKQDTFIKFQQDLEQEKNKRAVEELFNLIKKDSELVKANVFSAQDVLAEKLHDDFVLESFIKPFEEYHFYTTKIDGLGAAYEVLGLRAVKDVKAGQFFTPENVVRFMVRLAELDTTDNILDPACGTGRFLIYSMDDMISKVSGKNIEEQIKIIKEEQLVGSDYDVNVAKLAKMNMYIHKDGKTNIKDNDGLLLFDLDGKTDVILTNPPLGDVSYKRSNYDKKFQVERMEVIPKKNKTFDKLEQKKKKYQEAVYRLNEYAKNARREEIKAISRTQKLIDKYQKEIHQLEIDEPEFEITGNKMKGGALFINAAKYYLKDVRDSNALPEWRGGRLIIILDEGILNTEDYKETRDFIKKYFYIKAIISLTRDTFVPVSKTSTKTSILYAIKKDDITAVQQEPIFYAHVDKVGVDNRNKVCENHLFNDGNDILSKYFYFKENIMQSYGGLKFDIEKFKSKDFKSGVLE